jgi:hypothetical protein
MLKLDFSPEALEALHYWRFHHPHPLVQQKMEVVLLPVKEYLTYKL